MNTGSLTFFRFVAAMLVVFFHFGGTAGLAWTVHIGSVGLSFFFVLSGFVLFVAYKGGVGLDPRRFLVSRFSRIYPAYLAALLLMVLVFVVDHHEVDPKAFVLNVFMLQSWVSPYPLSLNYPGWSLSVEAFLYLTFPLVVGEVVRRAPAPRTLLLIAFAVWLLTQAVNSMLLAGHAGIDGARAAEMIAYFPLMHFTGFFIGIAGGYWFLRQQYTPRAGNVAMLVSASVIAFLVWFMPRAGEFRSFFGMPVAVESSLLTPVFLAGVLSVAMAKPILKRFWELPLFVVLGEASFSLYILQAPLYYLFSFAFSRYFEGRSLLMFACFVLTLMAVSVASLFLFEMPAGRLLRAGVSRIRHYRLLAATK